MKIPEKPITPTTLGSLTTSTKPTTLKPQTVNTASVLYRLQDFVRNWSSRVAAVIRPPAGKTQPTPEQAAVQLQALVEKFDLVVEPLGDLNNRLKNTDVVCWQGSAINLPTTSLPNL